MSLDFSHVDLGNLLTMLTVLGSVMTAVYSLLSKLNLVVSSVSSIGERMDDMEIELKKQTDILIELAQTRERMNALEKRIDDLAARIPH
jgi:Na+-transporting methylmalonyl-CoA/oxaloacetate decarboxylase gamma subunit